MAVTTVKYVYTKDIMTLRLGIMLSGGGRTMVNIAEQIEQGTLDAEIACVISSRSDVAGIDRARDLEVEPAIIRKKDHADIESFSSEIIKVLDEAKVDLVLQCGWMCLWQIPAKLENKVMNIHPSLLPMFGGKGMYGHHVHEAVVEQGCKISGCTVHFVNNEYDAGPIILQRSCPVRSEDTPDDVADKVFKQECKAYPAAIRLFASGNLEVRDGKVYIEEGI